MLPVQGFVIICALCSLRAMELQPTGSPITVDNDLLIELLKRMEDKDETIDELRKNQQRQETIIDTLRNDVYQMKFENKQLKESFSKCEVAIQALRKIISDPEYKTKKEETNVSDFENTNAKPFVENTDNSSYMSNIRDNPTKQLLPINQLIKRTASGPNITDRDSKSNTVGVRHAGTDLVAFFATLTNTAVNLGVGQNLKFDHVITNEGSAYNQHLGAFTAPVSGVYVIMATLLSHSGHNAHFQVVRNGNIVCYMYVGGGGGKYDTSAGSFVLFLNTGDAIAIQSTDLGAAVNGDHYSFFSGFLLKEGEQNPSIVG